jgi:NitT/TauT family transport system substrate-binding protein
MGTPPFIFANRVLGAHGIDAMKEIEWRVFPAGELGLALEKGEIDAIADSEPIGTLLLAQGIVRNIADQAKDAPYKDEYCCAVIANGKWLSANPALGAAATRALLKGAKWVDANPRLAAQLSVEKKYLASNPELNTTAIGNLAYMPSVSGGEAAVLSAAKEMKTAGMLSPTTDVEALAKKAFVHLDGVTDDWVKKVVVARLPGGQVPEDQAMRLAAELSTVGTPDKIATCCAPASKIAPRPGVTEASKMAAAK